MEYCFKCHKDWAFYHLREFAMVGDFDFAVFWAIQYLRILLCVRQWGHRLNKIWDLTFKELGEETDM